MAILGAGEELIHEDDVEDRLLHERFVGKYDQMHRLVREADGCGRSKLRPERPAARMSRLDPVDRLAGRRVDPLSTAHIKDWHGHRRRNRTLRR